MATYRTALDEDFVGQGMRLYRRAPRFLDNERLYSQYGPLAADVLHSIFDLDTTPRTHLLAAARRTLKNSPLTLGRLMRDAVDGIRAL